MTTRTERRPAFHLTALAIALIGVLALILIARQTPQSAPLDERKHLFSDDIELLAHTLGTTFDTQPTYSATPVPRFSGSIASGTTEAERLSCEVGRTVELWADENNSGGDFDLITSSTTGTNGDFAIPFTDTTQYLRYFVVATAKPISYGQVHACDAATSNTINV